MGTLLAIFCENKKTFFQCAQKIELSGASVRRMRATRYRYCLGDNFFYVPAKQDGLDESDRVCWVRDRELYSLKALNEAHALGELSAYDVRMGNTYTKRNREVDGRFIPIENFVGRELYENLRANPEALPDVSKDDFENLCAEIFVKRGFEVDLFRKSKDGGIDFLAVKADEVDPIILAIQCKQPDRRPIKGRKSLGRPVIQQIYGAAKAWDLKGAIAISGSSYSPDAAAFAQNKPDEMKLYDGNDIINWVNKYRWNDDE